MKRTYIQPQIILVQVELENIICNNSLYGKESTNVTMGTPTPSFDAPRTRLWGSDED